MVITYSFRMQIGRKIMNNKKGGAGAKFLLVLILMIASAVGGAYGDRILDGKLAARDAMKAVENVDISDYDTPEQEVIQGYIDSAKKDLETAKTRKEVYDIISDFIADTEKVQTINEKKLEEALKAAEEAKKNQYNNNNNSNNNSNGNNNDYDQNQNNGQDQSYDNNDSNDSGNYKSNNLNTGDDEEEDGGGFLNSLLGGLANGN